MTISEWEHEIGSIIGVQSDRQTVRSSARHFRFHRDFGAVPPLLQPLNYFGIRQIEFADPLDGQAAGALARAVQARALRGGLIV